jgi:hypothetical protein
LAAKGHKCDLRLGSQATFEALASLGTAEFFFFFGHGTADRMIGQPGRYSIPDGPVLLDVSTVHLLAGKTSYVVACEALAVLGSAYAALFPAGSFVGYGGPLGFMPRFRIEFGAVITSGGVSLVSGVSAVGVVAQLRDAWATLAERLMVGDLSTQPDAFLAGYAASENAKFVGVKP